MIKLTVAKLIELDPCDLDVRLAMFGKRKSMNAEQAFKAGATIKDLCWVAQKLGRKDLLVKFALKCAQSTAYLNCDPRAQAALDATEAWIANPSLEAQQIAFNAAAADAASCAANAACAAAYASDAVYAAACAAAYAVDAVYAGAYATAAAYAGAVYDASDAAYAADAYAAAYADADTYAADERKKEIAMQKQWFIEIFS